MNSVNNIDRNQLLEEIVNGPSKHLQFDEMADDRKSEVSHEYKEITCINEYMEDIKECEVKTMELFNSIKERIKECFEGSGVLEKEKGKFEMLPNELMLIFLSKSLGEEVLSGNKTLDDLNKVGRKLEKLKEFQ